MGKYFGTDGIRGKYGDNLNKELAYKTGVALVKYFGVGEFFIARDTRISGPSIEKALVEGITDTGANAVVCGVIPTPAIAMLSKKHNALCGIMISASHNPAEYNGIKIFDGSGVKLNEEQEGSLEYYIDNQLKAKCKKGTCRELETAKQEYIDFIVSSVDVDFKGLSVWLDCGYGSAGSVAKQIFEGLGATVNIENCSLRGEKINAGCGALYPSYVKHSIKGTDTKVGFAFDGDADRMCVVYENEIIDGDSVLYNISRNRELSHGVVVGTILSNLSLESTLAKEGKRLIRTPVGDKYICDLMFKKGYNLGGEQSGHFIVYPESTTGDGILSAIYFCKAIFKNGKLTKPVKLDLCPQKAIAEFAEPSIIHNKELIALTEEYTQKLEGTGRIIVRMSGTEPKVRVMVECNDMAVVDETLAVFKKFINAQKY